MQVPNHLFTAAHVARRMDDIEQGEQARAWLRESKRPPRRPETTGSQEREIVLKPLSFDQRSANKLRPATFEQMVGQRRLRGLMHKIVGTCKRDHRPLAHLMLAGQSGTGKTTLAQVTAHELGAIVFQVKAPVTHAVLAACQRQLNDGDVMIVDEIHQQVIGDRRGATQAADPEDFYHVMEDRRLPTETGMLPFPAVTFIGCTTDIGLLPEAFTGRFPLRLTLDPYTADDMATLAWANAKRLGVEITSGAAITLGLASRRNPRQLNDFLGNAVALGYRAIDTPQAREVIVELNGCTLDGLSPGMQGMLKVLLRSRRENRHGEPVYSASVSTVATALGHSRDTKAVQLFVEPYLIEEGYITVTAGVGRQLTDRGTKRALELP